MHVYKICRGAFRRLHKYFSIKADIQDARSEIRNILKLYDVPPLSDYQRKEIDDYFGQFGVSNVCDGWHRLATHVSGRFDKHCMPQDLFYTLIEPKLNMMQMLGIADKNLSDRIFANALMPESVVKCINGVFYNGLNNKIIPINEVRLILDKFSKLIIKPSLDSYGGKNIIVFKLENGVTDYQNKSIEELISSYGENFVIQEFMEQHEALNSLNKTSVNTIRMRSLFINNRVEILSGTIRIGREGSFVDNTGQGGLICLIDDIGNLSSDGFDGKFNTYSETDSGVKFAGFVIPNYEDVLKFVRECHIQIPYFRTVAWDIAINKNSEPVLIEYNVSGIGMAQFHSGPFFGPYTDEVMKLCFNKTKI